MTEIWKVIEGTSGMVEVSNLGRVRSLLRSCKTILKLQKDAKGYLRVRVTVNRQKLSFKVHREVAKAFIPNPANKPQVNHIDGNKTNNAVDNLEWATNKENAHHALENGLFAPVMAAARESNEKRKKPVVAIELHGDHRILFMSVSEAERHFNSRHITSVLKGQRAQVKGWRFEYLSQYGEGVS